MPTIEAIATIESPMIEHPSPDKTLSDAIAASDISTASIDLPVKEVVAIATVETLNDETGINSHKAHIPLVERTLEN